MFICDLCNESERPNYTINRVVKKTRSRKYKNRKGDVIATGFEIVKELKVCRACYVGAEDVEVQEARPVQQTTDDDKFRVVYKDS